MTEMTSTVTAERRQMVTEMFAAIDRMDVEALIVLMAEDSWQRFGNAEPLHGHQAIREANHAFLGSLASIHHEITDIWESDAGIVCRLRVTYGRRDGQTVTIPGVTIFKEQGGLISEYQVYFDVAPVFADSGSSIGAEAGGVA
jgi:ketosteroid isomerase-like protein